MLINFLLVALGASFGVITRSLTTKWMMKKWTLSFPLATFFINVTGSLFLGLITGMSIETKLSLLCGTGFLGAYTTFSTFNVENIELIRRKKIRTLISYAGGTYIFGILAAFLGILLGNGIRHIL